MSAFDRAYRWKNFSLEYLHCVLWLRYLQLHSGDACEYVHDMFGYHLSIWPESTFQLPTVLSRTLLLGVFPKA